MLIFIILLSVYVSATPPKMFISPEAKCCKQYYAGNFALFQSGASRQFIAGQRLSNEEPQLIVVNSLTECCNYISDKSSCLSCIAAEEARILREENIKTISFVSAAILAGIIVVCISLLTFFKIKQYKQEFYTFSWLKFVLFLVVLLVSGFFTLSQFTSLYVQSHWISSITLLVVILSFWPFLLMLGIEKLIFQSVDWIHPKDIPFLIVAFIVNVIYLYSISSLISLFSKKKR